MISKPLIVAAAVFYCLETSCWPDDLLEPTMICFNDVVQVIRCKVSCAGRQLAIAPETLDRFRIGAELIRRD